MKQPKRDGQEVTENLRVARPKDAECKELIDRWKSIEREGDEARVNRCIIVPETQPLCIYAGCTGSKKSA
jgi:flagellar motility protein MotE (MotC chaperone)